MSTCNDRLIDELQFWLCIMKEHAIFLCLAFPCDEKELIKKGREFEEAYSELEKKATCYKHSEVDKLAQDALNTTLKFIQFKTHVLDLVLDCKLGGFNYPSFVDHLRREAIYFAVNIIRLSRGKTMLPTEELLHNEVFWLRIMVDHTNFIRNLLDPSERQLIGKTQMLQQRMSKLRWQAVDFDSMLEITPRPVPSLLRFAEDTVTAGKDLRAFNAQAAKLIGECKALSVISPLLANHVYRESERFIKDIERDLKYINIKKPGPGPCPGTPCPGYMGCDYYLQPEETETKENAQLVADTKLEMELSAAPQPLYRPRKNFFQPNSNEIKINFRR